MNDLRGIFGAVGSLIIELCSFCGLVDLRIFSHIVVLHTNVSFSREDDDGVCE